MENGRRDVRQMLRLYAVTDRTWTQRQTLFEQVEDALRAGVTCVQLREKELRFEEFLSEATELRRLCGRYGVPLIINDNVEIAVRSGADGVHVGQEDMNAREIFALLPEERRENFIVGVTAKTVEAARRAQCDGASYIGSGAMFGSSTKKNARPMTVEQLREICHSVNIPVTAIGGINLRNCTALRSSGAAGIAVVSGIFAAEDIFAETRLLRQKADELFGG